MDIMILFVQFWVDNAFEIGKYEIIFEYRKNTFYVWVWTGIFKNYYLVMK